LDEGCSTILAAFLIEESIEMKRLALLVAVACGLLVGTGASRVVADELPKDIQACVDKGLNWMAKNQYRDGHWEAMGSQYPVTMTALGGMAFLMEGSTIKEGKYAENIKRAVEWLMVRAQPNGMLGNPNHPGEAGRYMYGHGFATLFLASVYGEEEEADRRKKLEAILTRAVEFIGKAQTSRKGAKTGRDCGGWGYVSAADGGNFDEGSVTVTQLQAVRAARNAGIVVPKEIIDKGITYLEECTNAQGGIIYSLGGGGGGEGRPALTAAAICCGFSTGEYGEGNNAKLIKQWLQFSKTNVPLGLGGAARFGHDEYTHYYLAQTMYVLGDNGWAKLWPESKESDRLTWAKYKKSVFDGLKNSQTSDGSWQGGHVGPVFITAVHLTILQLDKGTLPIYQH
jgi:hypothetical protein